MVIGAEDLLSLDELARNFDIGSMMGTSLA